MTTNQCREVFTKMLYKGCKICFYAITQKEKQIYKINSGTVTAFYPYVFAVKMDKSRYIETFQYVMLYTKYVRFHNGIFEVFPQEKDIQAYKRMWQKTINTK